MKTVVIHSGGLDSTVLLYHFLAAGDEVCAVTIDYGQRHGKEIDFARRTCATLGVAHVVADLRGLAPLLGGSSLTSADIAVAEGHYTEASMRSTVVPNRNMILLAVAAGHAFAVGAERLAYGAHGGDHAIYPDCRPEFAERVAAVLQVADYSPLDLVRPFMNWTKADIVRRGLALSVPFVETWSCYQGEDLHCGRCGTCIERREAFHLADAEDPTEYAATAPALADLIAQNWRLKESETC